MKNTTGVGTGNKRKVRDDELDRYETPPYVTHKLYEAEPQLVDLITLDPCCGLGAMSRVIDQYTDTAFSSDIRRHHDIDGKRGIDFPNSIHWDDTYIENVIFNPPFMVSMKFFRKALLISERFVCVFQRLQFLEGITRYREIFKWGLLKRIWLFSNRVDLYREGRTDHRISGQMAFAWFIFDKKYNGFPQLQWIDYKPEKDDLIKQQAGLCGWCRNHDGGPIKCEAWEACSDKHFNLCENWIPKDMVE